MQVAKQFIGESLLLILIALITGIAIAELALPTFNNLVGLTLSRKIPVRERRPQFHNTRLSVSSGQPRWHHSRWDIPPLSYLDCNRPKS